MVCTLFNLSKFLPKLYLYSIILFHHNQLSKSPGECSEDEEEMKKKAARLQ